MANTAEERLVDAKTALAKAKAEGKPISAAQAVLGAFISMNAPEGVPTETQLPRAMEKNK